MGKIVKPSEKQDTTLGNSEGVINYPDWVNNSAIQEESQKFYQDWQVAPTKSVLPYLPLVNTEYGEMTDSGFQPTLPDKQKAIFEGRPVNEIDEQGNVKQVPIENSPIGLTFSYEDTSPYWKDKFEKERTEDEDWDQYRERNFLKYNTNFNENTGLYEYNSAGINRDDLRVAKSFFNFYGVDAVKDDLSNHFGKSLVSPFLELSGKGSNWSGGIFNTISNLAGFKSDEEYLKDDIDAVRTSKYNINPENSDWEKDKLSWIVGAVGQGVPTVAEFILTGGLETVGRNLITKGGQFALKGTQLAKFGKSVYNAIPDSKVLKVLTTGYRQTPIATSLMGMQDAQDIYKEGVQNQVGDVRNRLTFLGASYITGMLESVLPDNVLDDLFTKLGSSTLGKKLSRTEALNSIKNTFSDNLQKNIDALSGLDDVAKQRIINNADFVKKSIDDTVRDLVQLSPAIKQVSALKGIVSDAGTEAATEFAQTLTQGLMKHVGNIGADENAKYKAPSFGDLLNESLLSALAGGMVGGIVGIPHMALRPSERKTTDDILKYVATNGQQGVAHLQDIQNKIQVSLIDKASKGDKQAIDILGGVDDNGQYVKDTPFWKVNQLISDVSEYQKELTNKGLDGVKWNFDKGSNGYQQDIMSAMLYRSHTSEENRTVAEEELKKILSKNPDNLITKQRILNNMLSNGLQVPYKGIVEGIDTATIQRKSQLSEQITGDEGLTDIINSTNNVGEVFDSIDLKYGDAPIEDILSADQIQTLINRSTEVSEKQYLEGALRAKQNKLSTSKNVDGTLSGIVDGKVYTNLGFDFSLDNLSNITSPTDLLLELSNLEKLSVINPELVSDLPLGDVSKILTYLQEYNQSFNDVSVKASQDNIVDGGSAAIEDAKQAVENLRTQKVLLKALFRAFFEYQDAFPESRINKSLYELGQKALSNYDSKVAEFEDTITKFIDSFDKQFKSDVDRVIANYAAKSIALRNYLDKQQFDSETKRKYTNILTNISELNKNPYVNQKLQKLYQSLIDLKGILRDSDLAPISQKTLVYDPIDNYISEILNADYVTYKKVIDEALKEKSYGNRIPIFSQIASAFDIAWRINRNIDTSLLSKDVFNGDVADSITLFGYAGTGKTYTLDLVSKLLPANTSVYVTGANDSIAENLKSNIVGSEKFDISDINSILDSAKSKSNQTVVFIDEVTMLSTDTIKEIQNKLKEVNLERGSQPLIKIVFVGDNGQIYNRSETNYENFGNLNFSQVNPLSYIFRSGTLAGINIQNYYRGLIDLAILNNNLILERISPPNKVAAIKLIADKLSMYGIKSLDDQLEFFTKPITADSSEVAQRINGLYNDLLKLLSDNTKYIYPVKDTLFNSQITYDPDRKLGVNFINTPKSLLDDYDHDVIDLVYELIGEDDNTEVEIAIIVGNRYIDQQTDKINDYKKLFDDEPTVKVITPEEAQGKQFDHVIVDIEPNFGIFNINYLLMTSSRAIKSTHIFNKNFNNPDTIGIYNYNNDGSVGVRAGLTESEVQNRSVVFSNAFNFALVDIKPIKPVDTTVETKAEPVQTEIKFETTIEPDFDAGENVAINEDISKSRKEKAMLADNQIEIVPFSQLNYPTTDNSLFAQGLGLLNGANTSVDFVMGIAETGKSLRELSRSEIDNIGDSFKKADTNYVVLVKSGDSIIGNLRNPWSNKVSYKVETPEMKALLERVYDRVLSGNYEERFLSDINNGNHYQPLIFNDSAKDIFYDESKLEYEDQILKSTTIYELLNQLNNSKLSAEFYIKTYSESQNEDIYAELFANNWRFGKNEEERREKFANIEPGKVITVIRGGKGQHVILTNNGRLPLGYISNIGDGVYVNYAQQTLEQYLEHYRVGLFQFFKDYNNTNINTFLNDVGYGNIGIINKEFSTGKFNPLFNINVTNEKELPSQLKSNSLLLSELNVTKRNIAEKIINEVNNITDVSGNVSFSIPQVNYKEGMSTANYVDEFNKQLFNRWAKLEDLQNISPDSPTLSLFTNLNQIKNNQNVSLFTDKTVDSTISDALLRFVTDLLGGDVSLMLPDELESVFIDRYVGDSTIYENSNLSDDLVKNLFQPIENFARGNIYFANNVLVYGYFKVAKDFELQGKTYKKQQLTLANRMGYNVIKRADSPQVDREYAYEYGWLNKEVYNKTNNNIINKLRKANKLPADSNHLLGSLSFITYNFKPESDKIVNGINKSTFHITNLAIKNPLPVEQISRSVEQPVVNEDIDCSSIFDMFDGERV